MTRRRRIALLAVAALLLVAALSLRWLLKPEHMAPAILDLAGESLGLEITAGGIGEYRLRGTPQLIVRDVTAREPGASTPLLRAERIFISVPWSTLRARGRDLTATRLELDAPVLDVAALQDWLGKRPPSDKPLPTLTRGIHIVRGSVVGAGWKILDLDAELESLAPARPLRSHLRGRYASDGMTVPADLHATLTRPGSGAGLGVAGQVTLQGGQWQVPLQVKLSAKLRSEDGLRLQRAVLAAQARYVSGDTNQPFALGIAGPLRFADGVIDLQPAGLALRGQDAMPTLDAAGGFSLGKTLQLELEGSLAGWPSAWPSLPPPLGQSTSPMPFTLSYDGDNDFSGVTALQLRRDDTRFDGRFRLFEITQWVDAGGKGSPLPPMTGNLATPRLEISGATLEGVEIRIDDPDLPTDAPIR